MSFDFETAWQEEVLGQSLFPGNQWRERLERCFHSTPNHLIIKARGVGITSFMWDIMSRRYVNCWYVNGDERDARHMFNDHRGRLGGQNKSTRAMTAAHFVKEEGWVSAKVRAGNWEGVPEVIFLDDVASWERRDQLAGIVAIDRIRQALWDKNKYQSALDRITLIMASTPQHSSYFDQYYHINQDEFHNEDEIPNNGSWEVHRVQPLHLDHRELDEKRQNMSARAYKETVLGDFWTQEDQDREDLSGGGLG